MGHLFHTQIHMIKIRLCVISNNPMNKNVILFKQYTDKCLVAQGFYVLDIKNVFFLCYFINRGFTGTAVLCWITQNSNYNTAKIGSECYNEKQKTEDFTEKQKTEDLTQNQKSFGEYRRVGRSVIMI